MREKETQKKLIKDRRKKANCTILERNLIKRKKKKNYLDIEMNNVRSKRIQTSNTQ